MYWLDNIKLLNEYYENNAQKLHSVVDKILYKFGGIYHKDYDDFYSVANEVFCDVIRRYDGSLSFEGFLYTSLFNRIKSEMTFRNREKRKIDRLSVSIYTPVGDDDSITIADTLKDNFDIEQEVFGQDEDIYSKEMIRYLNRLSNTQRDILRLMTFGYTKKEIREALHITEKEYSDCINAIRSYRNVSILF